MCYPAVVQIIFKEAETITHGGYIHASCRRKKGFMNYTSQSLLCACWINCA